MKDGTHGIKMNGLKAIHLILSGWKRVSWSSIAKEKTVDSSKLVKYFESTGGAEVAKHIESLPENAETIEIGTYTYCEGAGCPSYSYHYVYYEIDSNPIEGNQMRMKSRTLIASILCVTVITTSAIMTIVYLMNGVT
jgi:hypothetical protein